MLQNLILLLGLTFFVFVQVLLLLAIDCLSTALDIYWVYNLTITNFGIASFFLESTTQLIT